MPQISKPLIGHTTFTTSEKRRIGFLIGHTVFATRGESRIDFSRHWRPLTEFNFNNNVARSFNLKWLHDFVSVNEFIEHQEIDNTTKTKTKTLQNVALLQ